MRRAKIKPSINLAASRRPVRAAAAAAASSKDTDKAVPKSPAKNVRSAVSSDTEKAVPKSPAKNVRATVSSSEAAEKVLSKSPAKNVRATLSSSNTAEKALPKSPGKNARAAASTPNVDVATPTFPAKNVLATADDVKELLPKSSTLSNEGRMKSSDASSKQSAPVGGAAQEKETPPVEQTDKTGVKSSLAVEPSASEPTIREDPTTDDSGKDKAAGKSAENVAPTTKAPPRGRRKHAPTIPTRKKPRQRAVPATAPGQDLKPMTDNTSKEVNKVVGDAASVATGSKVDVSRDNIGVMEPPPVQRVISNSDIAPVPISISKTVTISKTMPANLEHAHSMSDEVEKRPSALQIPTVDESAIAKTATTKATSLSSSTPTPLRSIGGQADKKNPMNIYERKLRELKETLEEETPAKRRRRYVKRMMPDDRSNMTMSDLIYYNPKNNPMKQSSQGTDHATKNADETILELNKDSDNEDDDASMVDQFVPQVKIGPDGSLIVDQQSLTKDASPKKSFDPNVSDIVHEESSTTTYASFRKHTRTTVWTKRETEKFFRALSAVGTDFSMINAMFPKRTRQQIKNKFKREERLDHRKVDNAIRKTIKVSMSLFLPSDEDSEAEAENRPTSVKHKKSVGKKRHLSGSSNTNAQPTSKSAPPPAQKEKKGEKSANKETRMDLSEAEEEVLSASELCDDTPEPPPSVAGAHSEESEEDIDMESILSRPTRSGRQPKIRTSFDIAEVEISRGQQSKQNMAAVTTKSVSKVTQSYQSHRQEKQQALLTQVATTLAQALNPPNRTTPTVVHTVSSTPPQHRANMPVQHVIINQSPLIQNTQSPAGTVKTHIVVLNSPDGSQRIVQLPVNTTFATTAAAAAAQTPVHHRQQQQSNSPIVIHRLQPNQQPGSGGGGLRLLNTFTSPVRTPVITQHGFNTPGVLPVGANTPVVRTGRPPFFLQSVNTPSPVVQVPRGSGHAPAVSRIVHTPIVVRSPQTPVLANNTHMPVVSRSVGTPVVAHNVLTPGVTRNVHTPVMLQTVSSPQLSHSVSTPVVPRNITTPVILRNVNTPVISQSVRLSPKQPVLTTPQSTSVPSSVVTPTATSTSTKYLCAPPVKMPARNYQTVPPKVQRTCGVDENLLSRTQQQQQQRNDIHMSVAVAADGAVSLQIVPDSQPVTIPVVARQVECYNVESDSGGDDLESGPFIPPAASSGPSSGGSDHSSKSDVPFVPPVSATSNKTAGKFSRVEPNSDQLMISGLESEGISTRDIFDQISYEQDGARQGTVAANMEVGISEDIITQIATEIGTE